MKLTRVLFIGLFALVFVSPVSQSAPTKKYEVVEVKDGGSISGTILFKGTPPPPTRLVIDKDNSTCGTGKREIQEVRLNEDNLVNGVVYIEGIGQGKGFPEGKSELNQENCQFAPHLQVMKNKAKIGIMSKDPLSHTVHAYEVMDSDRTTVFNVAVPNQFFKFSQKVRLRKGKVVKVECDTHSFMHAWMLVLDHPYYSLVGEDGSFSLENVPAGTYQFVAWNPVLGEQRQEIKIDSGGKADVHFEFQWDGKEIDQR